MAAIAISQKKKMAAIAAVFCFFFVIFAAAAAEEGQVIDIQSFDSWNELFQKGKDDKQLVVVNFTAPWCIQTIQCRLLVQFFNQLAKKLPNVVDISKDVRIFRVDADKLRDIVAQWKVEELPTILFFKEGELVHKFVGVVDIKALEDMVTQLAV